MKKILLIATAMLSLGGNAYSQFVLQPVLVADIEPGPAGSDPESFTVFNNLLYFSASTIDLGREIWRYDGSAPPGAIMDICPGNCNAIPTNGHLPFPFTTQQMYFPANPVA